MNILLQNMFDVLERTLNALMKRQKEQANDLKYGLSFDEPRLDGNALAVATTHIREAKLWLDRSVAVNANEKDRIEAWNRTQIHLNEVGESLRAAIIKN